MKIYNKNYNQIYPNVCDTGKSGLKKKCTTLSEHIKKIKTEIQWSSLQSQEARKKQHIKSPNIE